VELIISFLIDATNLILGKIIRWSGSKFPTGDAWSYHQQNEYRLEGHAKFANFGLM
jgi:hypothetical protein